MKKLFKATFFLVLLVVIAIYAVGVNIFKNNFMPNTYINGKDFGLTDKSKLYENYNSKYGEYKLKIVERDSEETIYSKSFDYTDTLDKGQTVEQNSLYWPAYILIRKDYKLKNTAKYDVEKFNQVLSNLKINTVTRIEPQDATVVYDGNSFIIKPEVYGNKINTDLFSKKVMAAVQNRDEVLDLEKDGIYYNPIVKKDDEKLISQMEQKNNLNKFEITYDFADRTEVLKNEALVNLYSPNEKNLLVPDIEKVEQYIKYIAGKYDTFKTTRDFQTTGLGMARVSGGIYGWMTDVKSSTAELVKALENTKTVTLKPVYRLEGYRRETNDIGNSYIEIDLGRQHMWMYKDGQKVLETPIVSGNPNLGNATPTGTQKVWAKETNRMLKGATWESHVNYWMPFDWTGCGLHDSTWRSTYGGSIYKYNGSHGCVNTPPSIMPTLYSNAFYNMPVVVYDSNTQMVS
ncbi:Putative peptidoglycan binding domain-containing protein [Peptoniphilus asaccharolyticus DSM 20463]|uniref:Putative peptidoglycan binding domain-containing protein n=1 Tax=Peptoniphilus asaccharolyticus DSM 20463 TaxID=573058 RepID=A0A1W1VEB0_PEPAS|nr:L,D-transpeptidase family protein [Peptoniphilus asaccharolyticus]SMB91553.1 Putative peptidoglycan binding domain-containing protein [Peptoniphilus asaccharolyticus DSM 20463]